MQRYPLKYRQSTYNETDFYLLVPVGRRPIAPGETISKLVADIRFTSAVYEKANLTPILVQAWAFYVPNRLIWDQWIDFIAMDDAITTTPVTSTASAMLLEGGTGSRTSLWRRGYKLIYNQYFGDESQVTDNAWFADINDDTVITPGRLLIWDQFRAHTRVATYSQQNYLAAVSGATATIALDDFQRAMRTNNARRRQKITGDKYVDTMRLMGVELDWRIQMAPEFLGSSQQVIFGQLQQSAGSTDLTIRATNYEGKHQLICKSRKSFAEHGWLYVLAGFRPLIALQSANPIDAAFTSVDHYYRPDMAGGPVNAGTQLSERNSGYLKGRNINGHRENAYNFVDTSVSVTKLYPDPAMFVPATGSGPRAVGMLSDISVAGLTPVPSLRA